MEAKGTFEVKVTPAEASPVGKDADLTCYSLEKTFHGDTEGTAKGEMLASKTESTGAMAYVALDHLTVRLMKAQRQLLPGAHSNNEEERSRFRRYEDRRGEGFRDGRTRGLEWGVDHHHRCERQALLRLRLRFALTVLLQQVRDITALA